MSDGSFCPIYMVKIKDKIIDAHGDVQEVYDVLEYNIDEDILEIEFENGKVIRCTKDHKFLTKNRGWVEAQYLDENDDVIEV
jgi:DNA polymerase-3 subunit alpha